MFSRDTALAPLGPGRWRADYDESWAVIAGPFGGFIAALLARALTETTDRPPRTLAVQYLDAPKPGPLEVFARVEREGRSSSALALGIDQDGKAMARAMAWAATRRDDQPAWLEVAPPEAPAPSDASPIRRGDRTPNFFDHLEIRWIEGSGPTGHHERQAYNAAWLRLDPPAILDPVALAALADVWMPPAFGMLGTFAIVPTLDLTIHYRDAPAADDSWVLAEHRSHHGGGGTWTSDGNLWSRDGRLLVQVRQLAMLRA